jgi:hypothetical protein
VRGFHAPFAMNQTDHPNVFAGANAFTSQGFHPCSVSLIANGRVRPGQNRRDPRLGTTVEAERDTRRQSWTIPVRSTGRTIAAAETLKSIGEFLARRFPEYRRKACYSMSIHEHLPPQARKELKKVGWTKGLELAKVPSEDGHGVRLCNLAAQGALGSSGRWRRN